jgi:hypothetical protein
MTDDIENPKSTTTGDDCSVSNGSGVSGVRDGGDADSCGVSHDDSSTNTPHSGAGSSTTGTSYTGNASSGRHTIPEAILASKETRAVKWSRLLVFLVLAIAATVAGVLTYVLTTASEQNYFEVRVS